LKIAPGEIARKAFLTLQTVSEKNADFSILQILAKISSGDKWQTSQKHYSRNRGNAEICAGNVMRRSNSCSFKNTLIVNVEAIHTKSLQELRPGDSERRLEYCNWFLNNLNDDRFLIMNLN
jgi:hypothetical protein